MAANENVINNQPSSRAVIATTTRKRKIKKIKQHSTGDDRSCPLTHLAYGSSLWIKHVLRDANLQVVLSLAKQCTTPFIATLLRYDERKRENGDRCASI